MERRKIGWGARGGIWSQLEFWLRHDNWSLDEAAFILLNVDPRSVRFDEGDTDEDPKIVLYFYFDDILPTSDDDDMDDDGFEHGEVYRFRKALRDVKQVAMSGILSDGALSRSPAHWIEWAESKSLAIPWLEWARSERLVPQPSAGKPVAADLTTPPLKQRERTTLLVLVAALAQELRIDVGQPSKAAVAIEKLTSRAGARVAARTIEDHLKRIPDALERKSDS
jgi:hypothetical protein